MWDNDSPCGYDSLYSWCSNKCRATPSRRPAAAFHPAVSMACRPRSRLHSPSLRLSFTHLPHRWGKQAVHHNQITNKPQVLKLNAPPKRCSGSGKLGEHTPGRRLCRLPLTLRGRRRAESGKITEVSEWSEGEFMICEEGAGHCEQS